MNAIPYHRACPRCTADKPCGRARMCVGGREIGANVVHSNAKEIEVWRDTIAGEVRRAIEAAGLVERPTYATGGVLLGVVFWLERPQGHRTSKGAISTEGTRNPEPWHKPDVDKLLRAVLDACTTGEVYTDDAQNTRTIVVKAWGKRAGVTVLVGERGPGADRLAVMAAAVDELLAAEAPPVADLFGGGG